MERDTQAVQAAEDPNRVSQQSAHACIPFPMRLHGGHAWLHCRYLS